MISVDQSKLHTPDGPGRGNCYAACLASLLGIPLWMVPAFEDMPHTWSDRTDEWLARLFGQELVLTQGHRPSELPEFYIANGKSPRGVMHSVIYQAGQMAHDPHPSRAGIESIEWCWHLEPVG